MTGPQTSAGDPQWVLEALDLVAALGSFRADQPKERTPEGVLSAARPVLRRLLPLARSAFLLLEEDGLGLRLVDADPAGEAAALQAEVDAQVAAGIYAWAAQRNSAVQVPALTAPDGTVLLHALATRSRVLGMFIGKFVFRFHDALLLGIVSGARTTTASLGLVCDAAKSQVPALGYSVTYAVGNTLLTIWGMVLILLLS